MRTEFRIDSIAFGVLLAALCELPSAERWLRMAREPLFAGTAIAIGVAAALIGDDYFANVIRPSVLGAAIAIGLHAMVFGKYSLAQRLLAWRPATWTGQLSYSLYIWHIPAGMVAATYVAGIWAVPVSFLLSFLAAYASFTLIEQRMINVRKRFGSHARSNASNVTEPVVNVVARQSR